MGSTVVFAHQAIAPTDQSLLNGSILLIAQYVVYYMRHGYDLNHYDMERWMRQGDELYSYDMCCACGSHGHFRRLYHRLGGRGRQKFVPWGFECEHCQFIFPSRANGMETMKEQVKWYEEVVKRRKLIPPEIKALLDACPQNTSN